MYKAKTYYKQSSVAAEYDKERFFSWHGRLAHKMESRALESVVDRYFRPQGTVLDIPCGTGRLLSLFAERGYELVGADISEEMLQVARQRFSGLPRFSFQQGDAEHLAFADNTFDYLTSFRLMCHLPPAVHQAVLEEMLRVTRKVIVINYYFDVLTPLSLFNRLLRKRTLPPFPLSERALRNHLRKLNVELLEIRKLSWYERSSAVVVIQKP